MSAHSSPETFLVGLSFTYSPSDTSKIPERKSKSLKRSHITPDSSPNSEDSFNSKSKLSKKQQRRLSDTSDSSSNFSTPYQSPRMTSMDTGDSLSGQTSNPPCFEDFKALSEDKQKSLYNMLVSSQKETSELRKLVEALQETVGMLKSEVSRLSNGQSARPTRPSSDMRAKARLFAEMSEFKEEKRKQKEKATNLVLYGLPEPEKADDAQLQAHDKAIISQILAKSGSITTFEDAVEKHFRMGKGGIIIQKGGQSVKCPRLMKLQLKSEALKKTLLRKQKDIIKEIPELNGQSYSQYFREDLTFMQRIHYAELVEERNELNANLTPGETRWKIFNNYLIQDKPGNKAQKN